MSAPTALHQLGRFIVEFQAVEALLNEVLSLISDSDQESVAILAHELEYGKRLKTADVLFARFVGLHKNGDEASRKEFHSVMAELGKLGERRNELVHSSYHQWYDTDGTKGLLRMHSRLQGGAGKREETVEELRPEAFEGDIDRIMKAGVALNELRLRAIDWLHPKDVA